MYMKSMRLERGIWSKVVKVWLMLLVFSVNVLSRLLLFSADGLMVVCWSEALVKERLLLLLVVFILYQKVREKEPFLDSKF